MVGSRVAIRSIGLLSTILLARLLRPEDFGLVALAMALVSTVDVFGNFSFDLALIREGSAERGHYDTVWTLTIIRGVAVAIALAALAAPAGRFFGDARVEPIVYWLAAAVLVEGFANVGIVDFRRELSFDREFALQVLNKLTAFFATLATAFLWRQYWALVVGIVVSKITFVVLSYRMHPYRPQITLSQWRSLFGFSKWLLASNISNFLSGRLDTFVIGRVAGAHAVGLYELSSEIADLPTVELIWPIQRALFPGYAKLMGDHDSLARNYLGGLAIIMMIAMPMAVGIACTAPLIIEIFLGPQWRDALPLLQVLAIAGILKVGQANSNTVLLSLGRARLISHLSALRLAVFAVLVITATVYAGPIGAAYAIVAGSAILLATYLGITLAVLAIGFNRLIAAVWRSLAAVLVMAIAVRLLMSISATGTEHLAPLVQLLVLVIAGALVYVGVHLVAWRLAGSPDGPERDVLTVVVPHARQWWSALGLGRSVKPN